ncbi:MAG: RNA polymerase sigma factor [Thermoflexales bacterium]
MLLGVVESNNPRAEERELIARIRAGDPAACALCVESHAPALYRLALRLVGDPQEAEDVLQDTFLSAFQALHHFDGRSSLRTWLHRIAVNAALMRLRKRRSRVTLSLDSSQADDAAADFSELLPIVEPDAEALLLQQETAEMLGDAIERLPQALREVFVLRELEELSTAETAHRLGISEAAVKVRLHRARRALRDYVSARMRDDALPPAQSIACQDALRFLEEAQRRGRPRAEDITLQQALREHIAACERCRLLLDPRYRSVLFLCDDKPTNLPPEAQRRLYEQIRDAWRARL